MPQTLNPKPWLGSAALDLGGFPDADIPRTPNPKAESNQGLGFRV